MVIAVQGRDRWRSSVHWQILQNAYYYPDILSISIIIYINLTIYLRNPALYLQYSLTNTYFIHSFLPIWLPFNGFTETVLTDLNSWVVTLRINLGGYMHRNIFLSLSDKVSRTMRSCL